MKKVIVMFVAVGFIATACDWIKPKQEETPEIVDVGDTAIDSSMTADDSSAASPDSSVAVADHAEKEKAVK